MNVSDRRVAELKEQFPDPEDLPKEGEAPAFEFRFDETLKEDIGLWTELARVWFARL